jgi:hypothetical protein
LVEGLKVTNSKKARGACLFASINEWCFVDGGKTYRVDLDRRGERVSLELAMSFVPGQQLTPIYEGDRTRMKRI